MVAARWLGVEGEEAQMKKIVLTDRQQMSLLCRWAGKDNDAEARR